MNTKNPLPLILLLSTAIVLFGGIAVAEPIHPDQLEDFTADETDLKIERNKVEGDEIPFDEASIFFELNNTDGDLGIHALIDGEPWKGIKIESPDGRQKLKVVTRGSMRRHGMTELFFESAEPSFDELPPEVFFRRFPQGIWEVEGVTTEGEELESEVFLSHVIPAAPAGLMANGVELPEGCEDEEIPVVSAPVIISWEPVEDHHPKLGIPGDVEVDSYELVVENLELETTITVELTDEATEFMLPEDFTSMGSEFKLEILINADSGNRSASETCFNIDAP